MCVQVSRGFKLRMQTEFTCIFETQFRSQHFMFAWNGTLEDLLAIQLYIIQVISFEVRERNS